MPNKNTFDVQPIGLFVKKYLDRSKVSIDPFARDKEWATYTNDINPETKAMYHMDARGFLEEMVLMEVKADLVILDPPYSTRQMKECYELADRLEYDNKQKIKEIESAIRDELD